jgi:hypothetical protein
MMVRAILTLVFFVFVTAASAESLKLVQKYDAVGTNADGSKYTGTVTVKILSDTTFAIQWDIGGTIYKGFGMRRNDAVAATYTLDGEPGLIVYKVDGNGLDGLWAVRGLNGNGAEHLTPTK